MRTEGSADEERRPRTKLVWVLAEHRRKECEVLTEHDIRSGPPI